MQIKTKFIGSAILVMVLTMALSSGRILVMQRAETSRVQEQRRSRQAIMALLDLERSLQNEVLITHQFLLLQPKADSIERPQHPLERHQQSHIRFNQALANLEEMIPPEDALSHTRINSMKRRHQRLNELVLPVLTGSRQDLDIEQMLRTLTTHEQEMGSYLGELRESNEVWAESLEQERDQLNRWSQGIEALILGLILAGLWIQFRSILLPVIQSLSKLQKGTVLLGQGDLTQRVEIKTGDELAQLALMFNQMAEQLSTSYQTLENKVAERTTDLERANQSLGQEICDRIEAEANLKATLQQLQRTQAQLVQTEKMSSLGQLVAGVAHEINNPVSFIAGNLTPTEDYVNTLLMLIQQYQQEYPNPSTTLQQALKEADFSYIQSDFPKVLNSMQNGVDRIGKIVQSLKTFSRLDESAIKTVNIHDNLDSTLILLASRFHHHHQPSKIQIVKDYGDLPPVQCYAGQLNQVFMNILMNALDAIEEGCSGNEYPSQSPQISIRTEAAKKDVIITISDNGPGMTVAVKERIFDPFFTTKQVGKGTGLGLSMSYQIIQELHQGSLRCYSEPGQGTILTIQIPLEINAISSLPSDTLMATA